MSLLETSPWGRSVVLGSFLFAAACGGAQASPEPAGEHHDEHGEHHGEHGEHHGEHGEHHGEHGKHQELEGSLKAFHDVLAPAWHSEPGKTRIAAGCAKAADLRSLAGALETNPPAAASADAEGWKTDAKALQASLDALVAACGAPGQADVEPTFTKVHDGFHALMERGMKKK